MELVKLNAAKEHLAPFFADMERIWYERGGTDEIKEILRLKFEAILSDTIQGYLLLVANEPVALAWVEKTSPYYGNVLLKPEFAPIMAAHVAKSEIVKGASLELVRMEDTQVYHDVFRQAGFIESKRYRMALHLENEYPVPALVDGLTLEQTQLEHKQAVSEISCAAHRVSKDYEHYCELNEVDKRLNLEENVFKGVYGEVIREATLLMRWQQRPAGFGTVVVTQNWGYERLPWIFDLSIDPEFHGRGWGKYLLRQMLAALVGLGFPIVGLAVTASNQIAIRLYESLGFFVVEEFSEFIKL